MFQARSFLCRLYAGFYGSISCWKDHYVTTLAPLKEAYQVGLQTGDIESAAVSTRVKYTESVITTVMSFRFFSLTTRCSVHMFTQLNAHAYAWNCYESTPLPHLEQELGAWLKELVGYGQRASLSLMQPLHQMILNLMGTKPGTPSNPCILTGTVMNQEKLLQFGHESNQILVWWIHFCIMFLEYTFGNYESAERHSHQCRAILEHSCSGMDAAMVLFVESMTLLAMAQGRGGRQTQIPQDHSPKRQQQQLQQQQQPYLRRAKRHLQKLRRWAWHAPENYLGKQLLLEAECAVVQNQPLKAVSKYRSAILDCRDAGFLWQEALANERLADYYVERNAIDKAKQYHDEAVRVYTRWGALAKVRQLRGSWAASAVEHFG